MKETFVGKVIIEGKEKYLIQFMFDRKVWKCSVLTETKVIKSLCAFKEPSLEAGVIKTITSLCEAEENFKIRWIET